MRAVDTPIGKVVVLPPCENVGEAWHAKWGCDQCPLVKADRDGGGETYVVDVDVDCPTCEGEVLGPGKFGVDPLGLRPCSSCRATGTVSVRYVVTDVLPIYDKCPDYDPPDHVCQCWRFGYDERFYWHRSNEHPETELLVGYLPDAVPGGVVLVVQPQPEGDPT